MSLFEKKTLLRELTPLRARFRKQGRLHQFTATLPSLSWLLRSPSRFVRKLSRAIATREEFLFPAQLRLALIDEKERTLYRFEASDALLHRTFTAWAEQIAQKSFGPNLHSYQKGKSWWTAVDPLLQFLRTHRNAKTTKERGLYVMKRDVEAYTDSIPISDPSPLWPILENVLHLSAEEMNWAKQIIRPTLQDSSGSLFQNLYGVPTGSPVACLLFNIYLLELDQAMQSIEGGYYARYGDDFIFVHENKAACLEAIQKMEAVLEKLQLRCKPAKALDLYWTGCGRANDDLRFRGAAQIDFLGMNIHFSGVMGLRHRRLVRLREDLSARARAVRKRFPKSPDACAQALCETISWALDPESQALSVSAASFLRSAVTDRGQLKELDDWIYRLILRTAWGSDRSQIVRAHPPSSLRKLGLISLVQERNRYRKNNKRDAK